jgi:hypothetical protein
MNHHGAITVHGGFNVNRFLLQVTVFVELVVHLSVYCTCKFRVKIEFCYCTYVESLRTTVPTTVQVYSTGVQS